MEWLLLLIIGERGDSGWVQFVEVAVQNVEAEVTHFRFGNACHAHTIAHFRFGIARHSPTIAHYRFGNDAIAHLWLGDDAIAHLWFRIACNTHTIGEGEGFRLRLSLFVVIVLKNEKYYF